MDAVESGLSRVVGRRSWVALARQGSAKLENAINIARLSPNVRPTAATTTGTATARVTKGSCSWGRGRHGEGTGAGQREFAHAQTAHTYGMRWLSTDIGQCVAATEGAGCEWEWQKVRGGGCRIDIGRVSGVLAKRIRKSCLLASQFAGAAYGSAMQIRRRRTLHLPRSSFRPQGKPARANKKRNTRRNEGTMSRRDEVAGLAIVNQSGARAILSFRAALASSASDAILGPSLVSCPWRIPWRFRELQLAADRRNFQEISLLPQPLSQSQSQSLPGDNKGQRKSLCA